MALGQGEKIVSFVTLNPTISSNLEWSVRCLQWGLILKYNQHISGPEIKLTIILQLNLLNIYARLNGWFKYGASIAVGCQDPGQHPAPPPVGTTTDPFHIDGGESITAPPGVNPRKDIDTITSTHISLIAVTYIFFHRQDTFIGVHFLNN